MGDVYSGEESDTPPQTVVFENPDGSLHHGLPSGLRYKHPAPETDTPDNRGLGLNDWVIWDPLLLQQIERVYGRHERIFLILLFVQFLLENSFNALLIKHKTSTGVELARNYSFLAPETANVVFWVIVGTAVGFAALYYVIAATAVWDRKSVTMKLFSDVAVAGILGQILFAYINRFNLILFFLRFIVFAHSRFLHSILAGTARIVIAANSNAPILIDV